MSVTRREFVSMAGGTVALAGLFGCTPRAPMDEEPREQAEPVEESRPQVPETPPTADQFEDLKLDMSAWHYNDEADCYYQLGLEYCLDPASSLERLAVFVPGAYFKGEQHGSVYTCTTKASAKVGAFTPETAPVVMPVNSVRYEAQEPAASFGAEGLDRYLKAGFVYVYVGLRGRSSAFESNANEIVPGGAPWAVVDLKAAIRYLRYNARLLPCDMGRVFVFGMGGGGGLGMVAGASGDSPLFAPYLSSIGAVTSAPDGERISDAIFGTASWCPLTSFDVADAAYEWECGQYAATGARAEGTWGRHLSSSLVASYADWVNGSALVDGEGVPLTLESVGDGSFTAGTYYDHVLAATESAADEFFATTQFPYTYAPAPDVVPAFPGNPSLKLMSVDDVGAAITEATSAVPGVTNVQATVYESPEAYVEALNTPTRWLTYNAYRNTVRVSGLWDMARAVRLSTLAVGAFDNPSRSTFANQLFGTSDHTTLHFSRMISSDLSEGAPELSDTEGWDDDYPSEWLHDLRQRDLLGSQVGRRVDMMNPLSYVCPSYQAYGTSQVAPHWRVNAGLFQTETSLAVVANLAVTLGSHDSTSTVAFTPVWGRGFELAERTGDAQGNFVEWVNECCSAQNV